MPFKFIDLVRKKDLWAIFTLTLMGVLLFYGPPFFRDLWAPDEPRYAAIVKEMVLTGNWLLPHLNGALYTEKPPLYFWLTALSALLWGNFSNAALIFPTLISALGTLIITYFFGKKLFNRTVGFLGALVLATGALFLGVAQIVRMDMLLTFLLTSALFCFYQGYHRSTGKTLYYLAFYLLLALATPIKGPVAILLPSLVGTLYLTWHRDLKALWGMRPLTGFLLISLVLSPWLIAIVHQAGWEYLRILVIKQNLGRAYNSFSHKEPFYFYLGRFPMDFLPWSPFLMGALTYYAGALVGHSRSDRSQKLRDRILFLMIWFGTVFIFFSLMSGKLEIYLLPLYPAASLIVGRFWYEAFEGQTKDPWFKKCFSMSGLLLWIVFLLAGILILLDIGPRVHELPNRAASALFLGAGVLGLSSWRFNQKGIAFSGIIAFMILLLAYSTWYLVPVINAQASLRPLGDELARLRTDHAKIGLYKYDKPSYYFYTGSYLTMLKSPEELMAFLSSEGRVLCVLEEREFKDLRRDLHISVYVLGSVEVGRRKLVIISQYPPRPVL